MVHRSKAENETVIQRSGDEDQWQVWSADPRVIQSARTPSRAGNPARRRTPVDNRSLLPPFRRAAQGSLGTRAGRCGCPHEGQPR